MNALTKHSNIITSYSHSFQTPAKVEEKPVDIAGLALSVANSIANGDAQEQECPVTNRFAPGCYIREMFAPAGTLIIGKVHATEHFNILLKGKITVFTLEGEHTIEAPQTFTSLPGVQKVGFCHTDCIWQNIHPTQETDLEKIEAEVITETENMTEVLSILNKARGDLLCHG
ncbi:hypothetical protein PODOV084v1_p0049 [Vibrio phage 340E47.2]|nr:hypothetical protein PODOV084v1_p0049 [Vibrio phage 340E47.2]QZI91955.1 hypothetical protein PODOV077v1_p0044 [Vibrio phage 5P1a]